MSDKKVENRGGKRPGAGRKPIFELSESKRREIIQAVDKEAKTNGTSMGEEFARMMFGAGNDKRLKTTMFQTYLRDVLAKSSESNVNVNHIQTPQIFVPEELPDTDEAGDFSVTH